MNIIDLHCDTILRLMETCEEVGLYRNHYSVDIQKLRKGQVIAQFFALFVDKEKHTDPFQYCQSMVNRFLRELQSNQEYVALALNADDLAANREKGLISAFLTIEEGGVLQGKLENLNFFYQLGVRLITLTWNYPNELGYPNCNEMYRDQGLTPLGVEVVREMNKLGMMIDVSHLSDAGFCDVCRFSDRPVVASHSNARNITNHPRNLTDSMVKTLAQTGGVTGINFARQFLGDNKVSRVEDIIRHIQYIYNIGGIDVLAIGTDFDGISPNLEIAHSGEFDKLVHALGKSGFSEDQIEKICCKNALRVIKDCL